MSSATRHPAAGAPPTIAPSDFDVDETPVATIRQVSSRPTLPKFLKFPLVVLINFSITVLFNTVLVEFTGPQLYPVARDLREDWQIGVVAGWKVLELGLAWFAGFDGMLPTLRLLSIAHAAVQIASAVTDHFTN